MADYREISQEYAQQGIRAAILINAGAAVALLSQAAELIKADMARQVATAMLCWAIGTLLAAVTWLLAFLSTRYVDKSEREPDCHRRHLRTSDRLMFAGLCAICLALIAFVGGCVSLAIGIAF
jgi:hypothetical protein